MCGECVCVYEQKIHDISIHKANRITRHVEQLTAAATYIYICINHDIKIQEMWKLYT